MKNLLAGVLLAIAGLTSINASAQATEQTPAQPTDREYTQVPLPLGADVGWLTQLEAEGEKFYDQNGNPTECMQLLRDERGVNAIRLRVWVDPDQGWNGKEDVLAKSRRAQALGLPLMIDFHFSDSWADPGQQRMPKAWVGKPLDQLCDSVSTHVTDVLSALKADSIDVRWVQVGNEVTYGMMLPEGKISGDSVNHFPELFKAGYLASKNVYPDAPVILHIDRGHLSDLYTWYFDLMEKNNVEYDMIGMSFYPWPYEQWSEQTDQLISNIEAVKARYHKPVMIAEIGLQYYMPQETAAMIQRLLDRQDASPLFEGIFYWEPEAPAGYNGGYDKSCFIDGRPTKALSPFKAYSEKQHLNN